MKKRMKVATKLIFGFLVISILVGLVGFFSVYESSKALEKTANENSQTLAAEIMERIDLGFNERIEDFKAFSTDLRLQESLVQSNADFEKLSDIQGYTAQKDLEWVSTPKNEITSFMQQIIGNKLSEELREFIKFYEQNYGYKVYGEVFVTNKYGANVAQTGKTSDYRQDDEEWWQKGKEKGVYVENIKYDESADVYSTAIAIRVDDENGNFIGVMKVVLNIAQTISVVKNAEAEKTYNSEEFTIVDGNGNIIFSTRAYKFLEPYAIFKDLTEGNGYLNFKDETGKERLLAYAKSKDYKNFKSLGWVFVVDIGTDEILNPINKLITIILAFTFISVLLSLAVGYYVYSSISKSLGKFGKAVDEIIHGNMDASVEIKEKDEFRTLAGAFNSMVQELKSLKRVGIVHKAEKEMEAIEASHKLGFISEESYNKSKKRLTEILEKPKNIDARVLGKDSDKKSQNNKFPNNDA